MSTRELASKRRDISPLALDAWKAGAANSYASAIETVDDEVSLIEDDLLRYFVRGALCARIAHDADINAEHLHDYRNETNNLLTKYDHKMLDGLGTPGQHALYLAQHPVLGSMEFARHTHVGQWNTPHLIDDTVRSSFNKTPGLVTERYKEEPYYKIRQFGVYDQHPIVVVDRKRVVRRHMGRRVITIAKNSLLINTQDQAMRDTEGEFYEYLCEQYDVAMGGDQDYDYEQHSEPVKDIVEPHMLTRKLRNKPDWITPLVTTYYGQIARESSNS